MLIVNNHLSYADPVFIGAAFPRKVRYLAHEELANNRFLKWIFRLTSTLMVSSKNSLFSVKKSIMRVATGTALCLFAEGGISRLGVTLPFKRGSILLAKYGKVPILPVFLDGVWGSVYSNHGGRFFKKIPQSFPYRVSVRVGNLIQPDEATNESLRQAVMELGRFSFKKQIGSPKQMRQRLHKQIFSSSDGILFRDLNGLEITRKDFLQSIQSKHSKLPDLFNEWASQVVLFFDDQPDQTCLPWINWMRINQTNLMDHPMLSIAKGNKVWTDQWFPWFPLLCGHGFEETKNGCWNMITEKEALQPHMVEGLATLSNGLVSIQLPDEICKTTNQLGTKKGTVGRILPGFSYVQMLGSL